MNSNRFISRLMDQNLIRIIRIWALTFVIYWDICLDFFYNSMRFLGVLNYEGALRELCADVDVFFLCMFYCSFV